MDASNCSNKKKENLLRSADILNRVQTLCKSITKQGCHSLNYMSAAGFKYTGSGDTARCPDCKLEVSNWTLDMDPYTIHSKQKPDCPFIRSIKSSSLSIISSTSSTTAVQNTSISNEPQNPSQPQNIERINQKFQRNTLLETDLLQQVRRRTFSHWSHRAIPLTAQMIEAGFFNCNVSDRVICVYCNLICQQWIPHTDDPCEVHKTLSPNCIFVKAKFIRPAASCVVNENSTSVSKNYSPTSNNLDPLRANKIISTATCNPAYTEIPKRHASFATWPTENLSSVDDLVRAGFFYTGTKTIVTCFYCNGSLQNWGPKNNPIIEHARWFPHCAYAKQLCEDDLYRKIQESERVQQERGRVRKLKTGANSRIISNTNLIIDNRQLLTLDDNTLSKHVEARLDLPVSQRLLRQNFELSVIKRCWEDQLRLKQNDFASDCDLYIACLILQKQNEQDDDNDECIVTPSIKMKQIKEQNETRIREQAPSTISTIPNPTDAEMTTSSQSLTNESTSSQSSVHSTSKPAATGNQGETKPIKTLIPAPNEQDQSSNSTPSNPCVLCLTEEKRLACIPCGHLATCVPCGHSLRSCPICGRKMDAFVRIYI